MAVAIQGDRPAFQCADEEVCDPALIFGAELMRPVDAAHSEDHGRQPKGSRVVEDVLVGSTFGTSIRAVKIEPLIFANPTAGNRFIDWLVTVVGYAEVDIIQAAVDL